MGKVSLGKVKGEDGKNVFIKFNTSPSDTGASEIWQSGMTYIGFAFTAGTTAPATGYRWAKFVGEKGDTGAIGQCGNDGTNGINGKDGRGIKSITLIGTDSNGGNKYRITYTDENTGEFTAPRGPEGPQGPNVDTSNFVTKGAFSLSGTTLTITLN